MPASCTGVSDWPSAAQPTRVAVSGASRLSSETRVAGSISSPRNQSV